MIEGKYWRADAEDIGKAYKVMAIGLCLTCVGFIPGVILYAYARNRLNEHRAWAAGQSTNGWPVR